MMAMTPEQRTLRARMAAHTLHAMRDPKQTAATARVNSPSQIAYFEKQVDPDGKLDPADRRRRAESAKKAYFLRLSMMSAAARKRSGS